MFDRYSKNRRADDTEVVAHRRTRVVGTLVTAGVIALGASAGTMQAASADEPDLTKTCKKDGVTCTFEVQEQGEPHLEWRRYGEPVSNCNEGAVSDIESLVGDVHSFEESWTLKGGVELGLDPGLKVTGGEEYTQSRTITSERRDTIKAPAGYKNAVTLGTEFVEQKGRMKVTKQVMHGTYGGGLATSESTTSYVDGVSRVVATGKTEKGQDQVKCSADFKVPAV